MEKLLTIGDVYQPPTANELASAYSANLQNRLARMQMAEYEKKMAKEAQRNELAKKYFTAGSPQIGTAGAAQIGTPHMPAETVWGAPQQSSSMMSTLGQSPTGPYASNGELSPFATRYNPAQAASLDYAPAITQSSDYRAAATAMQDMEGYQKALYGAGDVEGAMAIQAQVEAQKEKAFTLSQKQIEPRMNFYKQFLDNAIKEGNNSTVQQVLSSMKADPALRNAIPADFSITVSPTGETQTVLDVKAGMPGPDGRPIVDPFTRQPVPPGKYKITAKGTQISKIEPIDTGMPYKIGERQKFTGAGGAEYEGTFKGLDERGEPVFGSQVAVKRPSSATTPPDFKNEMLMRKEFLALPEVKDYPTIEAQSNRALKALQEPSGNKTAVDQAIITTFNKMMDPSSVVRESEYARTHQDMALLNRIKGKWEKLASGGAGLTDEERQAMFRMVSAFKGIADEAYNAQVEHYSKLATQYGYKPENVVRLGGRQMGGVSASGGARPKPKF